MPERALVLVQLKICWQQCRLLAKSNSVKELKLGRWYVLMKAKIFYGWYIVAAVTLMNIVMGGVTWKGFTALINPIATTFGWGYAQITLGMSLQSVETGLLSPLVGRAVDRWPAKRLVLIGVTITTLGYLSLSRVTSLPMFYVSFMIIAFGTSLGLSMAPTTTVVRWFKKNVGKANGIMAMGIGLGGFAVPILVKIIDMYSWQTSMIIVAVVILAVGIPLSFVFRNKPEDYGMLPDGKSRGLSGIWV